MLYYELLTVVSACTNYCQEFILSFCYNIWYNSKWTIIILWLLHHTYNDIYNACKLCMPTSWVLNLLLRHWHLLVLSSNHKTQQKFTVQQYSFTSPTYIGFGHSKVGSNPFCIPCNWYTWKVLFTCCFPLRKDSYGTIFISIIYLGFGQFLGVVLFQVCCIHTMQCLSTVKCYQKMDRE